MKTVNLSKLGLRKFKIITEMHYEGNCTKHGTRACNLMCWNACDRRQEWSMSGDEPVSAVMSGWQGRREHGLESGLWIPPCKPYEKPNKM